MSGLAFSVAPWLHGSAYCGGNGVRHINEVKIREAMLVLDLMTTFGGSTVLVFIQATQAHSTWPSLRGYVQ